MLEFAKGYFNEPRVSLTLSPESYKSSSFTCTRVSCLFGQNGSYRTHTNIPPDWSPNCKDDYTIHNLAAYPPIISPRRRWETGSVCSCLVLWRCQHWIIQRALYTTLQDRVLDSDVGYKWASPHYTRYIRGRALIYVIHQRYDEVPSNEYWLVCYYWLSRVVINTYLKSDELTVLYVLALRMALATWSWRSCLASLYGPKGNPSILINASRVWRVHRNLPSSSGQPPACLVHTGFQYQAGHNKWSKIKRKKAVADMERNKFISKISAQITSAVQLGGSSDPQMNLRLGSLISQARNAGIPKSNIESAIRAGSSKQSNAAEPVLYEGRGPSGYLLLIETLTENKKRTRPEIRHILEKNGWVMFKRSRKVASFQQILYPGPCAEYRKRHGDTWQVLPYVVSQLIM